MTMHETINSRFPVRKTGKQKENFRHWVLEKSAEMGYAAKVEKGRMICQNHNVIIGDPEKAQVIVTAHYDTPAVMPIPNFITPVNVPVYLAYQLVVVATFFAVTFLLNWVTRSFGWNFEVRYWLSLGLCMTLMMLMIAGPANRHNANDNTSGVAAVMQLMAQLPEQVRDRVAFILFDNEEKGMLGSMAYAGMHKQIRKEKLLINLDCVGVGEDILFFTPKKTRALPAYQQLQTAMQLQQEKSMHFYAAEKCVYPSDQAQFTHGIAVCTCEKGKRIGYYCSRIHTPNDTRCDQLCLDALANGLQQFILMERKEAS